MKRTMVSPAYFWISTILPLLLLLISAAVLAVRYPALPAEIPDHFTAAGVPDGWTPKSTLWADLGIGLALVIGLLVLGFFPRAWRLRGVGKNVDPALVLRCAGGLIADLRIALAVIFAAQTAWAVFFGAGPQWANDLIHLLPLAVPVLRLVLRLYVLKR